MGPKAFLWGGSSLCHYCYRLIAVVDWLSFSADSDVQASNLSPSRIWPYL